jgi:LmbE family N-acetylglucosaminyl deacetylase
MAFREVVGTRAEDYLRCFDRLVVVAPHPDDDVLGCGGSLAAAAAIGLDIAVLYVTDGSASHVGSPSYPTNRLCEVREREARDALAILGVTSEPCFLRVSDGTVARLAVDRADAIVATIGEAIGKGTRPLVMGPWIRDHHTDHLAVAALVRRACARRPDATLLEYAVWLEERGTGRDRPGVAEGTPIALDVRGHSAAKSTALAAHRSQLGSLVSDARSAFVLPPGLIAAAGLPNERFLQVHADAEA